MNTSYEICVDGSGVDEMLNGIKAYKRWLQEKTDELAKTLADMGALYAEFYFQGATYDGINDARVSVEKTGENEYTVKADGKSVLFIEFGAGDTYGHGHPEEGQFGAGTYPDGKGHWNDPNGWWIPRSVNNGHSQHTYGNPPNMPMYKAVRDIEQELKSVVEQVFRA